MASNFHIMSFETKDNLYLRLSGNFDGDSAHELINTLKKHSNDFCAIYIDTTNLTSIQSFGRDVFQKNLKSLEKQLKSLFIFGANRHKFTRFRSNCIN